MPDRLPLSPSMLPDTTYVHSPRPARRGRTRARPAAVAAAPSRYSWYAIEPRTPKSGSPFAKSEANESKSTWLVRGKGFRWSDVAGLLNPAPFIS